MCLSRATIRPIVQIDGEAGFCQEFLDDVVVSTDDVIGEVNHGWVVAQTMLVYERGAGQVSLQGPPGGMDCWWYPPSFADDASPPAKPPAATAMQARRG